MENITKEEQKLIDYWTKECISMDKNVRYCNLATIDLFKELFPNVKNKKILDIGCGYDIIMNYFRNEGAKITGLDICPEVVENMKKRGFDTVVGTCYNLPFKDNTFDMVFSVGVVEHLKERERAINEHTRVTKKDGKVVVIVPNLISPLFWGGSFVNLLNTKLLKYGKKIVDGKYFTKKVLKSIMENSGCKDIKIMCYCSSSILRILKIFPKEFNLKLAKKIENLYLNKKYGLMLIGIGIKK